MRDYCSLCGFCAIIAKQSWSSDLGLLHTDKISCCPFCSVIFVLFFFFFKSMYIGAVLIFLPGLAEIKMLYEQLQSNALFNNRHSKR